MFSGLEHMSPQGNRKHKHKLLQGSNIKKRQLKRLKNASNLWGPGEQWALKANVSFNMGRRCVTSRKQSSNS